MKTMFKSRKELIKYIKALEEQITMLVRDDEEQQETIIRLSEENDCIFETQKEYGCRILDCCDYIEHLDYLKEDDKNKIINILQGEDK